MRENFELISVPEIKLALDALGNRHISHEDAYWRIGSSLLANARRMDLDEDINNLMAFAVGIAEELSPQLREVASRVHQGRKWDRRPLKFKVAGNNDAESDLRTDEKCKVGMTKALLFNLKREPTYSNAVRALLEFESSSNLWSEEDAGLE